MFVPFVARVVLGFYIVSTKPSKEKGLGYFFRTHIQLKQYLIVTLLSLVIGTALIVYVTHSWVAIVLTLIALVIVPMYKVWTKKNFGGASGDLYGAFIEGVEAILWIALLCLN